MPQVFRNYFIAPPFAGRENNLATKLGKMQMRKLNGYPKNNLLDSFALHTFSPAVDGYLVLRFHGFPSANHPNVANMKTVVTLQQLFPLSLIY